MELIEVFKEWPNQLELPKGAAIFKEGDDADFVYVVTEGEVELSVGEEPLAAELPGGIFGEMALVDARRAATARALRKSKVARITREQFKDLIKEDPEIAIHLIGVIANRLKVAVALLRF